MLKKVSLDDVKPFFKDREKECNKGDFGYIGLIGGCLKYSGALKLSSYSYAAMRSGAGVVKIATAKSICPYLIPDILETTLFPLTDKDGDIVFVKEEIDSFMKNLKAVVFGMGIGLNEEIQKILEYLLKNYLGTLVIDADGLNILSKIDYRSIRNKDVRIILTPHLKEFSRLTSYSIDEINENKIEFARKYAADNNVVLLLKGATTIVTDGIDVYLVDRGCPGMATAGSGDVLSGILGGVLGYIDDNLSAACISAYINGMAGEYAQKKSNDYSMMSGDTVREIQNVITYIKESK